MYKKIKRTLAAASAAIIAAPVKLPPKVLVVAKYVSLVLGILDALDKPDDGKGERHED